MKTINLIIAGIGPHAKTTYIPALEKLGAKFKIQIVLAIDLKINQDEIMGWFNGRKFTPIDFLFVDKFQENLMPYEVKKKIYKTIQDYHVDGIIISTEPCVHKTYADFALENRLNILLDKPITSYENVVSDASKAQQLRLDYYNLLSEYNNIQAQSETIFSINVKRRYHPVFWTAKELISEIVDKTNCPITSIQANHSDGQWRLPHEIMTFEYHPYNLGYGEISHSGYHIIDITQWLYESSISASKKGDEIQVFSSFLLPRGFFMQINDKDYINIFGEDYKKETKFKNEELWDLSANFGEMEAFSLIRILKNKNIICNFSINLSHNSFSKRAGLKSNQDLYKGNGRIRHESYNIQQGPFQNLQIHSYQAIDKNDNLPEHDTNDIGGENHFDVYVFRNKDITKDEKTLTILKANEIQSQHGSKPASETAKDNVVQEYLEFICGMKKKKDLLSNIDSHEQSVNIMSSLYMSHIAQSSSQNPVISFEVKKL